MPGYNPRQRTTRQKNFGRDLRKKATERQQRGGGSPMLGFRYRNRFKPPGPTKENPNARIEPARIRLIPGDYVSMDGSRAPYFEYLEHFAKRAGRGHICSKIWKELADGEMVGSGKCGSCWEIDENGARDISKRRLSGFLLLNYGWYYLVPAMKDGKVLRREKESKYGKKGSIIYDRMPEAEALAEFGRAKIKREGFERVQGRAEHWSMGVNHLLRLSAEIDDLERECRCGGTIGIPIWECESCGAEVIDLTGKDTDLTVDEVNQMTSGPCKCGACGALDLLNPVHDCDNCNNPDPLELWDVDLWVRREGFDNQSTLVISKHQYCDVPEDLVELIPERDILHRVFKGDDLDYQFDKILRIPNPFKDADTRRHVQDRDEGENPEDTDEDLPV